MAETNTTIWVYLARRDKTSVEILTVLRGREVLPVRIPDLDILGLPQVWKVEMRRLIEERKMEWELWAESAEDFDTLRERLKKRRYTNLPINGQPLFVRTSFIDPPNVNVNRLPKAKKMVKRKNQSS